jgi:hypothetical protein
LETYYNPDEEGTGHYNTAIGVLKFRVEELRNKISGLMTQIEIDYF